MLRFTLVSVGLGDLVAGTTQLGADLFVAAVAPHVQRDLVARHGQADHGGQVTRGHNGLAVHLADHVTGLQTRLFSGATTFHVGHQRTFGGVELEGVGQGLVDLLHHHPQAGMFDLAGGDDLVLDLGGQVDRDGKRHTLVTTGAAVDL